MDGLRAWSAAVCMAALGCAAVRLLAPKNATGKLFGLIASTFFLCCLLSPLLRVGSLSALHIDGLPAPVVSDLLENTVNEQLERQVKEAVITVAESALRERGITAEKIDVATDISDAGSIYIQHVTITVDKQNVPIAKAVGEVLEQQLRSAVEVQAQ